MNMPVNFGAITQGHCSSPWTSTETAFLVCQLDTETGEVSYVIRKERGLNDDVVFTGTPEECTQQWRRRDFYGWLRSLPKYHSPANPL